MTRRTIRIAALVVIGAVGFLLGEHQPVGTATTTVRYKTTTVPYDTLDEFTAAINNPDLATFEAHGYYGIATSVAFSSVGDLAAALETTSRTRGAIAYRDVTATNGDTATITFRADLGELAAQAATDITLIIDFEQPVLDSNGEQHQTRVTWDLTNSNDQELTATIRRLGGTGSNAGLATIVVLLAGLKALYPTEEDETPA